MNSIDFTLRGYLNTGACTIAVKIAYASKYSLFIQVAEDHTIAHDMVFDALIITVNQANHEFGSCKFVTTAGNQGNNGILVFLTDVYDFDSFFNEKKIINRDVLSRNLEVVLGHKERIHEKFIRYIAKLTYDLKVYKMFFDDIDAKVKDEILEVKEAITATLITHEGKLLYSYLDAMLQELKAITAGFSREDHENHGFYLRKQVWDVISCSKFLMRTNTKPRGYAGDSEMMRMIYANEHVGDSTFGKILHKYSLDHPAACAVRNRLQIIAQTIQEYNARQNRSVTHLLSVACGPAYELKNIFATDADFAKYTCTLLDQDPHALAEAQSIISEIEKNAGGTIRANYVQESVRTLMRTPALDSAWGTFDFIYSLGLYDYLTPPVAKVVTNKLFSLLKPGGQLLIGNYHKNNPSRLFMEYWHDWVLYYRDEANMHELAEGLNTAQVTLLYEDSNSQMFLLIEKAV